MDISGIPECTTPGESALKLQSTKRYRTVPTVFRLPEAVTVGTRLVKIFLNCYEKEFEVYPVSNFV